MADLKISELDALSGANLGAADELAIVDDSASETKKITVSDLIANGVTVISDDTIPGAKILFAAGDIAGTALANLAVDTAQINTDAVTGVKLANDSVTQIVTTLPAAGDHEGQLAIDTDDNNLYVWDGSSWVGVTAPGSINTVSGSTTGVVNIVASTDGATVTISATVDDTTAAAQFLAGPVGSSGTVGYRTIDSGDLPTAASIAKGAVIVNGNGLAMSGDTIQIDNTVSASDSTHHVVVYDENGLVTGGRTLVSSDLPIATDSARGAVIAGDGLGVDNAGNLSIDNAVTPGTYTKVTVTAQGVVSSATTLAASDIPNHSASTLTSGTLSADLIGTGAIDAEKLADESTTKFGGAKDSNRNTVFPAGDFKGQFFYDETTQDLYVYTGSSFTRVSVLNGNLVNAGAYNASTNQMSSVTAAGTAAGFTVGAALPTPAAGNLSHYVVVDTSGTGSGAAPAVALAPPDMLLSMGQGSEFSLVDVSNAIAGQTASNISFVASGDIIATNVQDALEELDSEKLNKDGGTMTGNLTLGTARFLRFEGGTADTYETSVKVQDPTADRIIIFPDVDGNVVTTGDTDTVTATMITDGTIVNASINNSADIAVSKLAAGSSDQILCTNTAGTSPVFKSNIDIPGTLDVTGAAVFDSTVGIGESSPAVELHVTSASNAQIRAEDSRNNVKAYLQAAQTTAQVGTVSAHDLQIRTNNTTRVTVDSTTGYVGINEGNPGDNVHLTAGSPSVQLQDSDGTDQFGRIIGSNGTLFLESRNNTDYGIVQIRGRDSSGTENCVRINTAGNMGVGLTNPSARIHAATDAQNVLEIENTGGTNVNFNLTDQDDKQGRVSLENGALVFSNGDGSVTERGQFTTSGHFLVGTTDDQPATNNVAGSSIRTSGIAHFSQEDFTVLFVNRKGDDGTLISFLNEGTPEGTISVSGTTVSYNGGHLARWSQLPGNSPRTEILRGTVLSNIDEMCAWGSEDNEQLNRMKVSDIEGDRNVAGVFQGWDDDDDTYVNDFYCAMTGDFVIRIAQGVTVERGDLLVSAGDGTAKAQDDDIIRSKTIAKVTSTNVSATYADGSYCVPCVLMAC